MALKDSKKVVVAVKYGGVATSTDTVSVSNEDVRLEPSVTSGSFKDLNGKLGNKVVWKNLDDVAVTGATVDGYLTGNNTGASTLNNTPPAWKELYKICGLSETVVSTVSSESVTYKPSQAQPVDTSEVAIWRDGAKRVLTSALGTLTIKGKVGEPITQSVSLSGFTSLTSTVEANPTGTLFNEALLLVLKSTDTVTLTGTSYKAQEFTLTQGNEIQKLYCIGTKEFERTDFDSTLELTYLKENETIYTDFANGTKHSVIIKAGTTNGKSVKITCGQAMVESVSESSINGKEAVTVKFSLLGDATGENQFAILFGTTA